MPTKTYHEFNDGEMIITFADLEGDLKFLERSLVIYKKLYQESFPELNQEENDFTLVTENEKTYIKLPKNVKCVNIGDLTDKSRSNTQRKEAFNLKLVAIINNTHEQYGEQMISILGNRENKFRLMNELKIESINKRFAEEVRLSPEDRAKKAVARAPHLLWVDGNPQAKPFLTYLIDELKWPKESSAEELIALFGELPEIQKTILYAKWQFANSTGAPDLWQELALENSFTKVEGDRTIIDDEACLKFVQYYFTNPDSPYVKYLGHCQIGAQIGGTLFTHGGIGNNSFILPSTLENLVAKEKLTRIFTEGPPPKNPQGKFIARNVKELLEAENAWYAAIWELYSNADNLSEDDTKRLNEGLSELVNMGLPTPRNNGETLINIPFATPLNEETLRKLKESGVHEIYHGHMPAQRPRICRTVYEVDGHEIVLHRIGADTCNYRKNQAAIGLTIEKKNAQTQIKIEQITEEEIPQTINTALPRKNQDGSVNDTSLHSLIGKPFNFCDEDKDWHLVRYIEDKNQYEFYRQNGFTPETRKFDVALLNLKPNEVMELQQQLTARNESILELKATAQSVTHQYIETIQKHSELKVEKELLVSQMNSEAEQKYLTLIHNKLLPMTLKYQDYITSQDLTPMDDLKKARTKQKITLMNNLLNDLYNVESFPRPSKRVENFFKTLNNQAEALKVHRNSSLSRFITNAVLAAGILITGILPGLLFLAAYANIGNTAGKSMRFWESRGATLCDNLQEANRSMWLK